MINSCEYLNVVCRLVHLDKLRLATRREESDVLDAAGGKDPDIIVKNASESKGGVIEKFIKVQILQNSYIDIQHYHYISDVSRVWRGVLLRCLC